LVSAPVPEMAPALLEVLPAPSIVRVKPAVVTAPDTVNVPPAELIVVAEPRVIAPDQVLVLARLRNAPPDDVPVPLRVTGSAMVNALPSTWIAVPADIVVAPAAVPSAAFDCRSSTPPVSVVAPV
jgi:hypothetical protein